ncbi:hypothetical protein B0H14DRAFT_3502833 [Mycena olivaceomarginata]|nr:hypothetical protein B0H14DRAFT_3502833 [Mycena olivaceomarginata]
MSRGPKITHLTGWVGTTMLTEPMPRANGQIVTQRYVVIAMGPLIWPHMAESVSSWNEGFLVPLQQFGKKFLITKLVVRVLLEHHKTRGRAQVVRRACRTLLPQASIRPPWMEPSILSLQHPVEERHQDDLDDLPLLPNAPQSNPGCSTGDIAIDPVLLEISSPDNVAIDPFLLQDQCSPLHAEQHSGLLNANSISVSTTTSLCPSPSRLDNTTAPFTKTRVERSWQRHIAYDTYSVAFTCAGSAQPAATSLSPPTPAQASAHPSAPLPLRATAAPAPSPPVSALTLTQAFAPRIAPVARREAVRGQHEWETRREARGNTAAAVGVGEIEGVGVARSVPTPQAETISPERMREIRAWERECDAAVARAAHDWDHSVFYMPSPPPAHEPLLREPAASGARPIPAEPAVLGARWIPVEPEVLATRESRVRRPSTRMQEELTRQKEEEMAKAAKGKKRARSDSENQAPCKKKKMAVFL